MVASLLSRESGYLLGCQVSPSLSKRLTTLVVCLLGFSPVWAHTGLNGTKAVWDGALHILTSPLSLAALVGAIAVLAGIRERLIFAISVIAATSAGTAFLISGYMPKFAPPAMIAVVGLLGVAAWRPSATFALVIAVFAGLAGGFAAELDAPSGLTIGGVFLAVMIILGGVLTAYQDLASLQKLAPILPIAKRVLGSWVAAMGLLMATLALHAGKH